MIDLQPRLSVQPGKVPVLRLRQLLTSTSITIIIARILPPTPEKTEFYLPSTHPSLIFISFL